MTAIDHGSYRHIADKKGLTEIEAETVGAYVPILSYWCGLSPLLLLLLNPLSLSLSLSLSLNLK